MRVVRIAVVALLLPWLFDLSRQVGERSGNAPVEGLPWAIGVLAVVFTLRAIAGEVSLGPAHVVRKDFSWGLAAGCALTAAWQSGVLG
ncbi:MAG: hypothetical protein SF182_08035 [Deltaproteobacteria bacterium]|nr:hypothetical protein [Deltaproteobacteria bacterium]